MNKFRVKDQHVAFCNAIAAGMDKYKAWQEYMSPGKKAGKMTAAANASKMLKRPEIKALIVQAQKARNAEITGQMLREVGKEFSTTLLTVDELDAFHSAVVQGLVEVEEVVQVYTNEYSKDGRLKTRTASFMRVKRPPNVKEKQTSVDALYKRFGNYAPSRIFGAFAKANEEGELEQVERVVMLSTGEKIPLLP